MFDTIIFDAEGVVIDTESIWDEEQKIFLEERGFIYERDKIKHLMTGKSLLEGILLMQKIYGFKGIPEELVTERKIVAKKLFQSKSKFIDGFSLFYQNAKKYYKVCIATSMERELLEIINQKLMLSVLFKGNIFSIADVAYISKPNPALFLYAANKLDSKPENCLVIEDAPYGIEAAKRAGMKCIALATTYSQDKLLQADVIVKSYSHIDINNGCIPILQK